MFHFTSVQYSESVHERHFGVRFEGLKQVRRATSDSKHEIVINPSAEFIFERLCKLTHFFYYRYSQFSKMKKAWRNWKTSSLIFPLLIVSNIGTG